MNQSSNHHPFGMITSSVPRYVVYYCTVFVYYHEVYCIIDVLDYSIHPVTRREHGHHLALLCFASLVDFRLSVCNKLHSAFSISTPAHVACKTISLETIQNTATLYRTVPCRNVPQ